MAKPTKPLSVLRCIDTSLTTTDWLAEQQRDDSLTTCWKRARENQPPRCTTTAASHYTIRNDLLYRVYQWYTGLTQCQLIVPEKQRKQVMSITHESTMGGHQGISKTVEKILTQFFGPGLHEDVALFCRSCDICQRMIPKKERVWYYCSRCH